MAKQSKSTDEQSLLDKFESLKDKLEEFRRSRDKAQGAYDRLLEDLEEKFDCETVDAGYELLETLQAESEELQNKAQEAWDRFQKKWGDKLDGI